MAVNVSKTNMEIESDVLLDTTQLVEGKGTELYAAAVFRLENLHHGRSHDHKCRYVQTSVSKPLIANSVSEFEVFQRSPPCKTLSGFTLISAQK